MPLNESNRKPRREKWPLEFDLQGIPRDNATRTQLLEATKEQLSMSQPQNRFAGESRVQGLAQALSPAEKAELIAELMKTQPVGREFDLGAPVIVPYRVGDPRNNYPKVVYNHETGHVLEVRDDKQQKAAHKRGFEEQPSPNHDYSKMRNGMAARKEAYVLPEQELSAEQLADLDAAEEENS